MLHHVLYLGQEPSQTLFPQASSAVPKLARQTQRRPHLLLALPENNSAPAQLVHKHLLAHIEHTYLQILLSHVRGTHSYERDSRQDWTHAQ